jgi:hypothetical protein
MSTNTCIMPGCDGEAHGQLLCAKHYRRWKRHGNPYVKRQPKCPVCLAAARIFRRPSSCPEDDLEKFADLFLLYKTGSPYRLTTVDQKGRAYDLEEDLYYAK